MGEAPEGGGATRWPRGCGQVAVMSTHRPHPHSASASCRFLGGTVTTLFLQRDLAHCLTGTAGRTCTRGHRLAHSWARGLLRPHRGLSLWPRDKNALWLGGRGGVSKSSEQRATSGPNKCSRTGVPEAQSSFSSSNPRSRGATNFKETSRHLMLPIFPFLLCLFASVNDSLSRELFAVGTCRLQPGGTRKKVNIKSWPFQRHKTKTP